MNIKEYTEANKEAWDEIIPIHQKGSSRDLKHEFTKKEFTLLDDIETQLLKDINLKGKKVAHLCCNNGRELLSVINIGAESGIGFDISKEAIKEANELRLASGLNCEFVRTDVYDINEKYANNFDLVYITVGCLNWLPDIKKFFSVVAKLLKDGGVIFIYEMHPSIFMLSEKQELSEGENPFTIKNSYFNTDAISSDKGIDYTGKNIYKGKIRYEFAHTLSEIFNSLILNGIQINLFNEYSHDVSACFENIEEYSKVPLSFILIGKKV